MREYAFVTGVDSDSLPTPATPTVSADVVTKGYVDTYFATVGVQEQNGTRAAPTAVAAGTTLPLSTPKKENVAWVKGTGAGTTTSSANPQITTTGATVGMKYKVVQRSATDFLKLVNGNGLVLLDGGSWVGDAIDRELNLWFDGTNWKEESRL
jgi:hypothetical protein